MANTKIPSEQVEELLSLLSPQTLSKEMPPADLP